MAWKRDDEQLYKQFVKDVLSPALTVGFDKIGIYDVHIDMTKYTKHISQPFRSYINYHKCFNEFGVTYYDEFSAYYRIIVLSNGVIYFSPQTLYNIPNHIIEAKDELETKLDEYVTNLYKELDKLDTEFKEANF